MTRPLPWVRLERDFYSEAAILEVCDTYPAAEVLASYAITLAEAARTGGIFESAATVERTLRNAARLKPQRAAAIVAAFISSGIFTESDGILRLTTWEDLKPKDRHLSKTQRHAQTATESVAPTTHDHTASVEENTTQHHERTNERTPQASATAGVEWLSEDTVWLPPRVEAIPQTHCSHGETFTEKRRERDGSTFISAGHRLDDGQWCKERPR